MSFAIKKVGPSGLQDALKVRINVFVDEQGVEPELELDNYDKTALHWIAYTEANEPVGVVRLVIIESELFGQIGRQGKLGRLAVIKSYRGMGLAKKLVLELENSLTEEKVDNIILHSQHDKQGFYERLGYIRTYPEEEPFMEDGILHVKMHKKME
ncbi:acyl-CoA N-acyltransferase [Neoconidiobolus thromboides FSU 785]|nr:acyl-CoA N-acyltransferase [Neoconidiobolus thromboides FSU 785]